MQTGGRGDCSPNLTLIRPRGSEMSRRAQDLAVIATETPARTGERLSGSWANAIVNVPTTCLPAPVPAARLLPAGPRCVGPPLPDDEVPGEEPLSQDLRLGGDDARQRFQIGRDFCHGVDRGGRVAERRLKPAGGIQAPLSHFGPFLAPEPDFSAAQLDPFLGRFEIHLKLGSFLVRKGVSECVASVPTSRITARVSSMICLPSAIEPYLLSTFRFWFTTPDRPCLTSIARNPSGLEVRPHTR